MLGQVALEEESGKATNGLGFAVVDRGPRELLRDRDAGAGRRYVRPIAGGEHREAWALTEPGAGSDLSGLEATATRDGDEWVLNGEKWFVTSEGDPGVYIVLAVAEGEQTLFLVEPGHAGLESGARRASSTTRTSTTTRRSSSRTAASPRRIASPRAETRARRMDPRRAPLHRGALLRRRAAARST